MAKITWSNKQDLRPPWDEDYQYTASNVNETKASINDLYDIVGAGATTDNQIVVSINTGGSTNKIKSTVEAIVDSSSSKRYLVYVRPGVYIEDNFSIPEYVALISTGTDRVTEIQANTTTGTLISVSPNVSVHGFTITGKTGGIAIGVTSAGGYKIHDMTFSDCQTCIEIDNAAAAGVISIVDFQDNITTGINIVNGSADIRNLDVDIGFTVSTVLNMDGSSSLVSLIDVLVLSSNVTTMISVSNGAGLLGSIIHGRFVYDGLVISGNNSAVQLSDFSMLEAQNDGVRIEATGTGIFLSMFSTYISLCANYNVNFLNSTAVVTGNGFTELNDINVVSGCQIYASILDTEEDNEGINILGELHVGTPKRPTESAFGEGDSHIRFLAYTTTDDVAFTDISVAARSASGSTFTFPSTASGSSIYVGNIYSDYLDAQQPFFGIKTLVTTAAVLGAGNFTVQYFNTNSGWLDLAYMETQSDRRYYQYADNIFTHTGSHHIRTDINLSIEEDVNLKWDTNDPVSYGTNLYWLRFRVENAITTAPIFQQFKVHSNRTEINADGWMEFFGNARVKGSFPLKLGAGRELSGSMADANIWVDENLGEGTIDNQFNLTTQYWGQSIALPDDLDTSSEINLLIACRGDGAGAVTLQVTVGKVAEGGTVYTSNPGLGPIPSRASSTDTQTFTGADDVRFFSFNIDMNTFLARKDPADGEITPDIIFFTINATVLPVNIQMFTIENYYYKWADGGHI